MAQTRLPTAESRRRVAEGPSFPARQALRLLRYIDDPKLTRSLDLSVGELSRPDASLPTSRYYALWEAAAEWTGRPHLALEFVAAGGGEPTHDVGALEYLVFSSPTVGDALERLTRYQALWNRGESLVSAKRGELVVLRFSPWGPPRPAHRHIVEKTLASLVIGGRRLASGGLEPVAVRIAHPRPLDADPTLPQRILGVRTLYESTHNQIELPRRVLAKPMRSANAALFAHLDRDLTAQCAGRALLRGPIVRAIAAHLHEGALTTAQIARMLGYSCRTFQRKLHEEDICFRTVVEEVRKNRAVDLLGTQLPITEIAFLLGFAEATNFSRAFRRWTGVSPSEWRRGPDNDRELVRS